MRGWLGHVSVALIAIALTAPAAASAKPPSQPQIYKVPGKIRSDCSVAVEDKLMAWLATVPDGSTVQFAQNGCYGQNAPIVVSGRNRLVLDGRGSEFRALTAGDSHRSNWRFVSGSDLTVQNMAVRGSDPTGAYDAANQWQHGFSVEGVQGLTFTNVQVRETWGDAIDIYRGGGSPACGDDASSARNVLVQGATLERIGRQGVAVVDGEHVTVQNSAIGPVGWWGVDVETDAPCDIARHVTVTGNTFGANGRGVIGLYPQGSNPQVWDVSITNNVQTGPSGGSAATDCYSPVSSIPAAGAYPTDLVITGNHFLARRYAVSLTRWERVQIDSNTADFDTTFGCSPLVGVNLVDAHTVAITNNVFNGASAAYAADASSSDVTASGNTPG
jgi:hypothetical protein